MDNEISTTVTASGATNAYHAGITTQTNQNDLDSSLTSATPGVSYHYPHYQYHYSTPQQQHPSDDGRVCTSDTAIQTTRDGIPSSTSDPSIAATTGNQSTNVTTNHLHSPPAYSNHVRKTQEPSPNSANAARALSSLFYQCPPGYHNHQHQHQRHNHPYAHQQSQNYHQSSYAPNASPPSSWGGPPPPRYVYQAPPQNQHSPSWYRDSPYSNITPHSAQRLLYSNHQSPCVPSLTSNSVSFESSFDSREPPVEPHYHQPVPSCYARPPYHEAYPQIYPHPSNTSAAVRYSPLSSQPKRLLCDDHDGTHDENKVQDNHIKTDSHLVTPTPKKMKPNEPGHAPSLSCEEAYSRKSKSLGLLCENFCKCDWSSGIIGIDEAAKLLGVERRRIYDVINILESLDIVQRKCKNRYEWLGFARLPHVLAEIQEEGISGSHELGEEARRLGVIGQDELTEFVQQKGPAKKSLGRLSRQYLQLFLVGNEVLSLIDASDRIMGKAEEPEDIDDPVERKAAVSKGQKTKIRRLYDIANVLASIGLVFKADGDRRARPTFTWVYHWSPWQIRKLVMSKSIPENVMSQVEQRSTSVVDHDSSSPRGSNHSVLAHIHEHGARDYTR